jgi:hypothetical protein
LIQPNVVGRPDTQESNHRYRRLLRARRGSSTPWWDVGVDSDKESIAPATVIAQFVVRQRVARRSKRREDPAQARSRNYHFSAAYRKYPRSHSY